MVNNQNLYSVSTTDGMLTYRGRTRDTIDKVWLKIMYEKARKGITPYKFFLKELTKKLGNLFETEKSLVDNSFDYPTYIRHILKIDQYSLEVTTILEERNKEYVRDLSCDSDYHSGSPF